MIRTRDFLLFLIVAVFLVVGIGVEFINAVSSRSADMEAKEFVPATETPELYSAEVISSSNTDNRESRLAELRRILAEQKSVTIAQPKVEEAEEEDSIISPVATSTPDKPEILLCGNYHPNFVSWPTHKLENEEREGVRVFYSKKLIPIVSTSTTTTYDEIIHAVLPVRDLPLAKPNCIVSDVVGIALDGSLIRNKEYRLYGVFDKTVQVGYALDGFPIFGTATDIKTDVCGGTILDGAYRYYLNKERQSILGCFSGIPIKL